MPPDCAPPDVTVKLFPAPDDALSMPVVLFAPAPNDSVFVGEFVPIPNLTSLLL